MPVFFIKICPKNILSRILGGTEKEWKGVRGRKGREGRGGEWGKEGAGRGREVREG